MLFAIGTALLTTLSISGGLCVTAHSAASPAGDNGPSVALPDSEYRALYEVGIAFADFLARAERRRKTWHDNYERDPVPDSLLDRARAVGGPWHLLVVAEDWCGDSANTIPYVAKLVDAVRGLEMRLVDSEVGQHVMESHRTSDGRTATPTVVLLDAEYDEVGCWVERPSVLQEWFQLHESELDEDELYRQKYDWYERDAGRETLREIIEMLEAGAGDRRGCGDTPPDGQAQSSRTSTQDVEATSWPVGPIAPTRTPR